MERQRQKKQNRGTCVGYGIQSTDRMFSTGWEEYLFPEIGRNIKVAIPYFDN